MPETLAAGKPGPSAFPRLPLYSALALIAFAIAATWYGKTTETGTLRNPVTAPVAIREIVFEERAAGVLAVLDAPSRETLEVIAPEADGFIRGSLRAMTFERKKRGVGADEPYRIIQWDTGRVTVSDPRTGLRIHLDAFGPTNSAAYARFLTK